MVISNIRVFHYSLFHRVIRESFVTYSGTTFCESFKAIYYAMEEDLDVKVDPLSLTKKNKKGQVIHKRERLLIVNLYKDLKEESPEISKKEAYAILSKRTGFGVFSIKKTWLEYERTGNVTSPNTKKLRITCNQKVDEFDRSEIRRKVHEFYINKKLPTLAKVLQAVNNDENLPKFKRTNFWKLLKELNFTFIGRRGNCVLTESDDLILWRRNYLKAVRKFREDGRPIYYLDETCVNAGDVSAKVRLDITVKSKKDAFLRRLSTGPSNPTGKSKRLIVLHIGSTAGFVPDGLLCFESKNNTVDYHDEMNSDTFLEWFEKVLPSLEDNAVIVMDNAPYHSVKLEKVPNASWKKAAIIEWLESKGKAADMTMLRAELLQIVALIKDKYVIEIYDEKAKEHNKTVLKLPPYHCELNPIEMVWLMVMEHVKSHNNTFKINDVKILLEQGIERVTAKHWSYFVKHVIEEEKRLWETDEIADRMIDEIQSLII